MLILGIPKEIKLKERRVGLTPEGARLLCEAGASILIETQAGVLSGFSDEDYLKAGAEIISNAKELYERADLIQKVKEPLKAEFEYLKADQIIFCFLHLASGEQCNLVEALVQSKTIAIGFETLKKENVLPILAPMSMIAGGLSAAFAACLLNVRLEFGGEIVYSNAFFEALGEIGENYPSPPNYQNVGSAIIFGGGVAGRAAAKMIQSMKGKVLMVDSSEKARDTLKIEGWEVMAPEDLNNDLLKEADIFIGAAHSTGARAVNVMNKEVLELVSQEKKKVIMDISIDQGGNFPGAKSTSYEDPVYLDEFLNLRFAVPNLPSYCSRQASVAITEAVIPYSLALTHGYEKAIEKFPELKAATNICRGVILNEFVKKSHER